MHHLDVRGENERAWQLPFRCKGCPDRIGETAVAAGALTLERDVTPVDMTRYQPHQRRGTVAVHDPLLGLGNAGRLLPRAARLRLAELAADRPEAERVRQREGTRDCVTAGRASEPTPRARRR